MVLNKSKICPASLRLEEHFIWSSDRFTKNSLVKRLDQTISFRLPAFGATVAKRLATGANHFTLVGSKRSEYG